LPLKIPGVDPLPAYCRASITAPGTQINNVNCQQDGGSIFRGSIDGNQLTVTDVYSGTLAVNKVVTDAATGMTATIMAFGTGSGATGTYILDTDRMSAGPDFTTGGITFDGWDFSVNDGIYLNLTYAVNGPVVIRNSKFGYGSNFAAGGAFGKRPYLINLASAGSLLFANNYIDANGPQSAKDFSGASATLNGGHFPMQFYYNVFLRGRARDIASTGYGQPQQDVIMKYNYFEGLTYASGEAHGEITIFTWTGTMNNFIVQYNTWLEPSTSFMDAATNGITGTIVPSLSIPDSTLDHFVVDHDVHVGNYAYVDGAFVDKPTQGAIGAEFQMAKFNNVTLTNNWLDPTAAWYCFFTPGDTQFTNLTIGGNVNLLNGKPANGLSIGGSRFSGAASLSEGVLTVTSLNSGGVGVGSQVYIPSLGKTVQVVSQATGTGGLGAYRVDNQHSYAESTAIQIRGDQCNGNGAYYRH
jgi:hypothetical protein